MGCGVAPDPVVTDTRASLVPAAAHTGDDTVLAPSALGGRVATYHRAGRQEKRADLPSPRKI